MTGWQVRRQFARGWRAVAAAGPRRLALTGLLLVIALLLARFSWTFPWIDGTQRLTPVLGRAALALFDVRSDMLAEVREDQDSRILLIVYNDETLIKARKRSPLDRGLLARALRNLDGMGAKAIGIDILFDQPQDEDPQLVAALRAMKTPVSVGYAETSVNVSDIKYEQQQFLDQFMARLEGSNARPASIALPQYYGVTRLWPPDNPKLPPSLSKAMMISAGEGDRTRGYTGSIRFKRPAFEEQDLFTKIPIDNFVDPDLAAALAPVVAGRYVLIGGDLVDVDRVDTTLSAVSGTSVPGLEVHAQMLAQMLDGARMPKIAPWVAWAQAFLVVIAGGLTALLEIRTWKFGPLLLAQLVLLPGIAFFLQWRGIDTYGFPSLGPILGWVVAFTAVVSAARASVSVQRRFAMGALGKYLPREMAAEILERPELLALHGEKKNLCVLFSDLEGFTEMSHAMEPETVARLLNRYLDSLSAVVLQHGGVIDKFVGDAVVAFWGAPIARPDDAERAARAAYALWQAGEEFRKNADPSLPPIGRTRVGLHYGAAVVGNFGGESRIQYTALGDTMNTASRLESANKALKTNVLASKELVEQTGLGWWRPMGRIVLRGRAQAVTVYDIAPDFPEEDHEQLERALSLLPSDRNTAIAIIAALSARYPDDIALENLLRRTRELNDGDTYVLG